MLEPVDYRLELVFEHATWRENALKGNITLACSE